MTSPDHAGQHANVNDAVVAIETAIGTTGAPVLAPLASPTFTGTVTVPDAVNPTDAAQLSDVTDLATVQSVFTRTGAVVAASGDYTAIQVGNVVVTTTQSATPAINTDNGNIFAITALAQAITSMTTNLTGTPVHGQVIWIEITDNATARAIAWGTSFAATTIGLPTTTVISKMLRVALTWNVVNSTWDCIGVC
jgi:hypothetical protein